MKFVLYIVIWELLLIHWGNEIVKFELYEKTENMIYGPSDIDQPMPTQIIQHIFRNLRISY
jgi:hypothetical protein